MPLQGQYGNTMHRNVKNQGICIDGTHYPLEAINGDKTIKIISALFFTYVALFYVSQNRENAFRTATVQIFGKFCSCLLNYCHNNGLIQQSKLGARNPF